MNSAGLIVVGVVLSTAVVPAEYPDRTEGGLRAVPSETVSERTAPASSHRERARSRVREGPGPRVKPGGWVPGPVRDARRRWRVNFSSPLLVDLYLAYPNIRSGDPPDDEQMRFHARKTWLGVTSIRDDSFLPWHHEVGVGRVWVFYLHNPGPDPARTLLKVDTSGKPTPEERRWAPVHLAVGFTLFAGTAAVMVRLVRWRRSRGGDPSW